jgi:hypothetical protein
MTKLILHTKWDHLVISEDEDRDKKDQPIKPSDYGRTTRSVAARQQKQNKTAEANLAE